MCYILLFLAALNALFAIKGVVLGWPVGIVLLNTVSATVCAINSHRLINK